MNKSNFLISTFTAFAIVGTIGLAVAQTTTPTAPTTPADAGAPMQATPNSSTGTMPSTTPSSETMVTERPSQIDRN